MRVTKRHTGNRRSHHALKTPRLSKCDNCGGFHKRHNVCPECGMYRGKQVLKVVGEASNKIEEKVETEETTPTTSK